MSFRDVREARPIQKLGFLDEILLVSLHWMTSHRQSREIYISLECRDAEHESQIWVS